MLSKRLFRRLNGLTVGAVRYPFFATNADQWRTRLQNRAENVKENGSIVTFQGFGLYAFFIFQRLTVWFLRACLGNALTDDQRAKKNMSVTTFAGAGAQNRFTIDYITHEPTGAAHSCQSAAFCDDLDEAIEHALQLKDDPSVEAVLGIEDKETGETLRV